MLQFQRTTGRIARGHLVLSPPTATTFTTIRGLCVSETFQPLLALMGAAFTLAMMVLLNPVARWLDLLDHPKGRKDHAAPTPVTGGIAMALGIIAVRFLPFGGDKLHLDAFISASLIVILTGILDDRYDLRWYWRIAAQICAALVMVYGAGVRVEHLGPAFGLPDIELGWLSVPFTVFATVGLINAINMCDGADGLAGLLTLAACIMLGAAALYSGNMLVANRQLILVGVLCAFLLFNMRFPWQPRARLFMGNAGSAFLGLVIAWQSFRLSQNHAHPVSPVLALWFLPIPVMDTLVLIFRRMGDGKSPFAADRNHIHHLMMEGGFGPTQSALTLAFFSGICGLIAGQLLRWNVPHVVLLIAFFVMCIGWYWMTAHRVRAIAFFEGLYKSHLFGARRGPQVVLPDRRDRER